MRTHALLAIAIVTSIAGDARADRYDDAVKHAGRSADDLKRDPLDHPAEILRLAKIDAGMTVADILGADGYFSELASYLVGPKGHVWLVNNPAYAAFSDSDRKPRLAKNRLPNVEDRVIDPAAAKLGDATVDVVLLVKVYHDLYWVDDNKKNWPDINAGLLIDQVVRALKPNGMLLVEDHSTKPGSGTGDATKLHRIEEAFVRAELEKRGLKLVGTTDVLRQPADKRDQISYKPPMLGKTDRFVLVFQKAAK